MPSAALRQTALPPQQVSPETSVIKWLITKRQGTSWAGQIWYEQSLSSLLTQSGGNQQVISDVNFELWEERRVRGAGVG